METPTDVEVADGLATVAEELVKEDDSKETPKERLIRYIGALFMEENKGKWYISIGRISWWLAFSPALYIWIDTLGKQDITPHHLTVLLLLAAYNMSKKGLEVIKSKISTQDGPG